MKKGKLFLGVAASLLGVVTLASCGSDGITTELEDVTTVTSDVIKNIVEDDEYKVKPSKSVKIIETDEESVFSTAVSDVYWSKTRTTSDNVYLYSLLAGKDICSIKDVYSVRRSSYSTTSFVSVINRIEPAVEGEDPTYTYDVYDYLGNKVISYSSDSAYDYSFDQSTSSYYDGDDNYHTLYTYKLQKADLSVEKFYYDYCSATGKVAWSQTNPMQLNLGKPGYYEYNEGVYLKVEELTDGMLFYLATDTTDYSPVKLPSNINGMFIANNKLIYQTTKLLPDEAKDYSYYEIDTDNGETIKYELVSYSYDFNTSELKEIELDYVITASMNYDLTKECVAIRFVKLENGEFNEDRNTLMGFVDSEGVIKYTSDKDIELSEIVELDNGNYYDGDKLYDSNLNVIAETYRRLNANLFIDDDQNRIYDKSGNIVKEFNNYSVVSNTNSKLLTIDGVQYELKDSSLVELGDNEMYYDGFIYKITKLDPVDESAQYKIEVRIPASTTSVTYYANSPLNLGETAAEFEHVCYVVNGAAYKDKEMTKPISYIIFS